MWCSAPGASILAVLGMHYHITTLTDIETHNFMGVPFFPLEAGAQCISSARWDLYGGCRVTGIPTVNFFIKPIKVKRRPMIAEKKESLIFEKAKKRKA